MNNYKLFKLHGQDLFWIGISVFTDCAGDVVATVKNYNSKEIGCCFAEFEDYQDHKKGFGWGVDKRMATVMALQDAGYKTENVYSTTPVRDIVDGIWHFIFTDKE